MVEKNPTRDIGNIAVRNQGGLDICSHYPRHSTIRNLGVQHFLLSNICCLCFPSVLLIFQLCIFPLCGFCFMSSAFASPALLGPSQLFYSLASSLCVLWSDFPGEDQTRLELGSVPS